MKTRLVKLNQIFPTECKYLSKILLNVLHAPKNPQVMMFLMIISDFYCTFFLHLMYIV